MSNGRRWEWLAAIVAIAVVALLVVVLASSPPDALTVTGAAHPVGEITTDEFLSGNPTLDGVTVVATTGSAIVGFDIRDGHRRWKSKRCDGGDDAGRAASREGSMWVVVCGDELRGLDLLTGQFAWSYQPDADWTMVRVGGGRVAVALGDHVDALDLRTGERLFRWKGRHAQDEDIVVTLDADHIYAGEDDRISAVGPDGRSQWVAKTIPSSLWAVDGEVWSRYEDTFLRIDAATGKTVASVQGKGPTSYSMIVGASGGVAGMAYSDEDDDVFGVPMSRVAKGWPGSGGSYITASGNHIAFSDDGACLVRRIDTGATVGRCGPVAWGVGLDADRVAYLTPTTDGSGAMRITVERLPGG